MSCETFSVASIRQHLDGIHAPRVLYKDGVLTMMGRSIPVRSPEQLEARLIQIGCNPEVIEEIVGRLFGFRVAAEAPIALVELSESLV